METFFVKEVKGKDLNPGDYVWNQGGDNWEVIIESDIDYYWDTCTLSTFLVQVPSTQVVTEDKKPNEVEINFDGNLLAKIAFTDKEITVISAMNGYGNGININKITINGKQNKPL